MNSRTRQWIGTIAFAIFGGLLNIIGEYKGPLGIALGVLAGLALAVALRMLVAEARDRDRRDKA
jgi:hypothetical protein